MLNLNDKETDILWHNIDTNNNGVITIVELFEWFKQRLEAAEAQRNNVVNQKKRKSEPREFSGTHSSFYDDFSTDTESATSMMNDEEEYTVQEISVDDVTSLTLRDFDLNGDDTDVIEEEYSQYNQEIIEQNHTINPSKSQSQSQSPTKSPTKHKKVSEWANKSKEEIIERLESDGRVLALIKKSAKKRISKRRMSKFLKKKGVSQVKISQAYKEWYKQNGLYEVRFDSHALGFRIKYDQKEKSCYVSSIQNDQKNKSLINLRRKSILYEINGTRIDDMPYDEIKGVFKKLNQKQPPFCITFKHCNQ